MSQTKTDPIDWTPQMLEALLRMYPKCGPTVTAKALGVSRASVRRKARALGLPPVNAKVMQSRGFQEYEAARRPDAAARIVQAALANRCPLARTMAQWSAL